MCAPITVAAAIDAGAARLAGAGIEAPRHEARLLLAHALGRGSAELIGWPERAVEAAGHGRYLDAIAARAQRAPLAYIVGRKEFWSLEFALGPGVLVPRSETETLVAAALTVMEANARILDLGTGSGCILIALLSEASAASGLGIDVSAAAVAAARANAAHHGLDGRAAFCLRDWCDGLAGPWDLIVANPPYVSDADIDGLAPEVAHHEPRRALAGGPDGLDAYRALIGPAAAALAPGGHLVVEIGQGQGAAVAALIAAAGLSNLWTRQDLAGIERCVVARRSRDSDRAPALWKAHHR